MNYIAVIHKDAGSDYGVSFPDFPGCITAGRSLDEAKDMAGEALAGHVAEMQAAGEAIPAPSSLDAVQADPDFQDGVFFLVGVKASGRLVRINITVGEADLSEIDKRARAHGMSRSAFLAHQALRGNQLSEMQERLLEPEVKEPHPKPSRRRPAATKMLPSGATPLERVSEEEIWESWGLNPRMLWAWRNLPLRRELKVRLLPDGSCWVIEAFRGLELGRFDDEGQARTVAAMLNLRPD